MTRENYEKLSRPFRENEKKRKCLVAANRVITAAFYVVYILLIIALIVMGDTRLLRVILVPLISFIAVSIFRRLVNAKRPAELWDIEPLIDRKGHGCSFPSRHVFSVFILAMTMAYFCLAAAIVMMAAGIFLAVVRVIAGVHFPRDVIAGAVIGIGAGILGFGII
ncbi:MAG: phosphatase PAP2 family protein [Clostridiales bacterium]|nr:phosphatase PAP2 family protein [Clostridiales bacterium]